MTRIPLLSAANTHRALPAGSTQSLRFQVFRLGPSCSLRTSAGLLGDFVPLVRLFTKRTLCGIR